jgi:hypothetical protein
VKMPEYSDEKLASLSRDQLINLRANAERLQVTALVVRCDLTLLAKPAPRAAFRGVSREHKDQDFVHGYHFVCSKDRGVIDNPDGTFWSGSWVVAEEQVKRSLQYGAYLALHEAKRDQSYRQGEIIAYRTSSRSMIDKDETGIEFQVRTSDQSVEWNGGGSGEKGYLWQSVVTKQSLSQNDEA